MQDETHGVMNRQKQPTVNVCWLIFQRESPVLCTTENMYIWLDAQELQGNYMEKHEMLKDMSMGIAR